MDVGRLYHLHRRLQYLLALAGMILIWLGYRLLRSQLIGKKTLQQAEQDAKERYRQSLH